MDYEKKYKEALERAREWYNNSNSSSIGKSYLYAVFPELKESEDERIRKELIAHCRNTRCVTEEGAEQVKNWIAWLEKQGEQKPTLRERYKNIAESEWFKKTYEGMSISDEEVSNVNKVEPKFKVGDWVVNNDDDSVGQITKIIEGEDVFAYEHTDSYFHGIFEKDFHLWTIQDAKNGDVLSDGTTIFIFKDLLSDGSVMSYCDCDADNSESDAFCPSSVNLICSKITPATKEQRDLLFQKMREAGYGWDTEKKELKKIKQKPIWNQEDREYMESLLDIINGTPSLTPSEVECHKDWLKNLKQRIGG